MESIDHDDDLQKIRVRLHHISDTVHGHGMRLELHSLELVNIKKTIEGLEETMATSTQLESLSELMQVKLDHVSDELSAIRKVLLWAAGLILSAVVMAVVSLVVKGAP